jgi:hypothetical protein
MYSGLIQIVAGNNSSKVSFQPIVLTIKRSDIQKEIAELDKANLAHMFFKKKAANKVASASEKNELKVIPHKQPTKPSLKTFGYRCVSLSKFSTGTEAGKAVKGDPNVLREIDRLMKENDVLASMGGLHGLGGMNTEASSISEGRAHLHPRLKSLD